MAPNGHGISCTSTLKKLSEFKKTGRVLVSDLMPMLYAILQINLTVACMRRWAFRST